MLKLGSKIFDFIVVTGDIDNDVLFDIISFNDDILCK